MPCILLKYVHAYAHLLYIIPAFLLAYLYPTFSLTLHLSSNLLAECTRDHRLHFAKTSSNIVTVNHLIRSLLYLKTVCVIYLLNASRTSWANIFPNRIQTQFTKGTEMSHFLSARLKSCQILWGGDVFRSSDDTLHGGCVRTLVIVYTSLEN